ncbi:DUF551 domain-containing protein [Burkholderia multivorans]|uniref:DUF551 domain-containing protein n=1 Tax=Burkholderia multivorans TaxID=87883 RepID=UPI0020B3F33E|nr:DUF551 domain-containing protein [Burkholderia multivorans]
MKITHEMLKEVEPIVAQWIRERGTCMDGASYAVALELAAYVAARRTTPDREAWISVSESVPQTADFVLAVNKLGAIKCAQYWHGEWIGMGGVTHWMPLPAAPTSDQGEKS